MYTYTVECSGELNRTNDLNQALRAAALDYGTIVFQGNVHIASHCGYTHTVKATKNATPTIREAVAAVNAAHC